MSPIDRDVFAACMAPFEPFEDAPFLAVAVSGGADSLALTLLAVRWARARGGRVVGLSVDHGLRTGSASEAHQVGRWLEAHGIEHRIMTWSGKKPETGLQRKARDARYGLLTDWCRAEGCLHLLTAHHRQDQAETVAIRKARQSGDAGLAAMAAAREIPGLRLLRPLLGIDKSRLEATLRAISQSWLDDPSNRSPAFTRNRLRSAGLDVDVLTQEAARQGRRRSEADRQAAATLVQHAAIDPAGFATLDRVAFNRLAAELALDVLSRLLMTIGGRIYPPRNEALLRLSGVMRREVQEPDAPAPSGTLAFCRILPQRNRWLICRERAASGPLPLEPGRRQRWDDRFTVILHVPRQNLSLNALGDKARLGEKTLSLKGKARKLPGAVEAVLPAIWQDEKLVAIPHLGLFDGLLAPQDIDLRFCPNSPLAKASFMPHISR